MTDWELGIFQCMAFDGAGPVPRHLGGWVKAPFAIDPRYYNVSTEKGWVITHIPSGFVVRAVKGDLSDAKRIADEVLTCWDWNFTDPSKGKNASPAIKALMQKYPGVLTASTDFDPPCWLDA